jgi:hypothetical protein
MSPAPQQNSKALTELQGKELQAKLKSLVGVASFTEHKWSISLPGFRPKINKPSAQQNKQGKGRHTSVEAPPSNKRQVILIQMLIALGLIFGVQRYMEHRNRIKARIEAEKFFSKNNQIRNALGEQLKAKPTEPPKQ